MSGLILPSPPPSKYITLSDWEFMCWANGEYETKPTADEGTVMLWQASVTRVRCCRRSLGISML